MKRFLLLQLTAVLGYVLAFPPVDFFPAGVLALAAWGLAFRRPMGWREWLVSYGAGVALFSFGCSWIAVVSFEFLLFMAVFEGLAIPLFGWIYGRMIRRKDGNPSSIPFWLALPLAWVAVEYLRSIFPLDGFPWLNLGYILWRCPPLIQVADITGVYGLSFLVAMSGGLLAAWVVLYMEKTGDRRKRPVKGTLAFTAVLAAVLIYGFIRPATLEIVEGPKIAAVQANLPQELKNNTASIEEVYERYLRTTRFIFEEDSKPKPEMLVWPETVYPYGLITGEKRDLRYANKPAGYPTVREWEQLKIKEEIIKGILSPHDTWFLVGAEGMRLVSDGVLEERNGAFFYDPSGRRKSEYYKTILVPGGEYLPLIDYIPFADSLRSYALNKAGFLPDLFEGFGPVVMTMRCGGVSYDFGVQICYENIYGNYCRRFIKQGAEFLINISNEGWFKTSSEFDQMLAMSTFRAVETRKSLFRATNTGISCLIGPEGGVPGEEDRITSEGRDRAVQGVLIKEVPLCRTGTIYTQVGDLFGQAVFFGQIILLLFLLFKPS